MTLQERVDNYNRTFPKYPCMWFDKGWIMGVWNMGNNYKGSGYHGAYPPQYIRRIMALFPDKKDILHLFSGSVKDVNAITFDINPANKPSVVGDAHYLSQFFSRQFDLQLSDCPYTPADAEKYGYPMINRFTVVKEAAKTLKKGGHLCWMDQRLPMYRKSELKRVGEISISRSTNHLVRAVFIFEKL